MIETEMEGVLPFISGTISNYERKRKVRNTYASWLTPRIKRLMLEKDKLKRAEFIKN